MSNTTTAVQKLKINRLTDTQFEGATPSNTELYLVDPEFQGSKVLATDSNGDIVETNIATADIGTVKSVNNVSPVSGNVTIPAMTGADGTNAGTSGLVPAPAATDNTKYLRGDGTWQTVSGGGGGGVSDVQVDGTSVVSDGVANIVLTSYEKKATVENWGLFAYIYLADGTIFTKNTASSSLYVQLPQTTYDVTFLSQINFVSSSLNITFNSDQSIKYIGDDCEDYVFIPVTSKRYVIIFYTDSNLSIIGVVKGTSV